MGSAARIAELAELLTRYKHAYYNAQPLVTDAVYDALEDELRELAPEHALLAVVGSTAASEWQKARHAIPMGSLNKAVNEPELRKWAARCDELGAADGLPPISANLLVTEKLDGLSIAVTYHQGAVQDAITRGDGLVGENITPNVRRMQGVLPRLPGRASLTVRGEIILKRSDLAKAFPGASNPRNQAAGTSKRLDGAGCEHLTVVFYDLDGEEHATEAERFDRLRALGFVVPPYQVTDVDGVLEVMRDYAGGRRATLDYEIDGLVIKANELRTQHLLGEKGGRPRAAVAYKFASQAKVTRVASITWETGPSGRVTPMANVEAVDIGGATVQRVSLHTAANVAALGVGAGDEVLVSRRNDVIPYLEEVVAKHGATATLPTSCATCGGPLISEGEYLLCRNLACRAIVEGRIKNWIGVQDVLEFGEKLITQLVDAGLVKEPADLYRLGVADIAGLERRGTVIATKVLDNLRAKLPLPLPVFLAALGIESFGIQSAKAIVAAGCDTLDKAQGASFEALSVIPGLGPAKARAIVDGLQARAGEIARLLAVGVVPATKAAGGGALMGKTFCFTGSMTRPRKDLEDLVEQHGGSVLSGVTKELAYLVMADPESASTKADKARKYGTQCISEEAFLALLDGAAPAAPAASDDGEEPAAPKKATKAKPAASPAGGRALAGISVCFTGAQPRGRKALERMVADNGGSVLAGVNKSLTYLVLADPDSTSSKAEKARAYGTQCIDLAALEKLIRDRGGAV